MFAHVAVPRGAPDALTYSVPEALCPLVRPGVRVRAPLRAREVTGVVVAVASTTEVPPDRLRSLVEVLDPDPVLPEHLLELAEFVSSYYRCPMGDTLATMLPAGLLRRDAEEVELTERGRAADPNSLSPLQGAILTTLAERGRARTTAVLAHAGAASRTPLDSLRETGLIRIRRRRRDRPPRSEVAAVALADRPLDELLAACGRSARRRQVVEWLAAEGRPALLREVISSVGCSPGVVRALVEAKALRRFTQAPQGPPRWALRESAHRPELTDEQAAAVSAVGRALDAGGFAPFLLEGITGSGKTEVYLRCLEKVVQGGGTGLVLVPEIGLTPAAVGAVEQRFGSRVAMLHSAQSDSERWREWRKIQEGHASVVVGPRSALFAPLENLGLVVVDEEHDAAYKQQEAPRYHARDLALVLAQRLAIPVLLCSATPSVEAAGLVARDLATPLALTRRVAGGSLPEVELVDLRGEPPEPGEKGRALFSRRLVECLVETFGRGEQAILLMQRRGWAPVLLCRECGHTIECPDCSVALVVHQRSGGLACHYCGHRRVLPTMCPACGGALLESVGAGTEKVAHYLGEHFPGVRAAILDRDTVRRRGGLEETLGAFAAGRVQVLVGTQMVAKGHHFPGVTLTGVISADAMLGLPDFRAGERTFQLLTQVAGRAGRGDRPGRVVIQTYYPDHPAVRHASHHDVASFTAEELIFRRAFHYPPAVRMGLVRFEAPAEGMARRAAEAAALAARPLPEEIRLRGPAAAPMERLRGAWRWQLLVSAPNRHLLREVLERVETAEVPKRVKRVVDVDPLSTL